MGAGSKKHNVLTCCAGGTRRSLHPCLEAAGSVTAGSSLSTPPHPCSAASGTRVRVPLTDKLGSACLARYVHPKPKVAAAPVAPSAAPLLASDAHQGCLFIIASTEPLQLYILESEQHAPASTNGHHSPVPYCTHDPSRILRIYQRHSIRI